MTLPEPLHKLLFSEGSKLDPGLVAVRAVILFVAAIVFVRWAQRRFIAQASPMDMVMTVVFGSTLSRGINGGATLASSLAAGLMLVVLQRVFAQCSAASPWFGHLAKGRAEVLVENGILDDDALRRHALTPDDLQADMRMNGRVDELRNVRLATLERSGQISVVPVREPGKATLDSSAAAN